MHLHTFTTEKKFWQSIGEKIEKIAPQTICASGGSSAKIFDQIFFSGEEKIFIADERFVDKNHKDANIKLLTEKIFPRQKTKGKIFSWKVENFSTPEECAQNYEKILEENLGEKIFSLTLLGVGPDGHTASLFPNIPELDEEEKTCVATKTKQFAIEDRLSMTFSRLQKSDYIFILMMGAGKKEILEKISDPKTDYHDFPARKILDFKNVEIFFLDM